VIVVVAVVVFVAGGGNTKTYTVPSGAMRPTYDIGDQITVNLDAYKDSGPTIGDVVVFHPPKGADAGTECGVPHSPWQSCPRPTSEKSSQTFLKRVVAEPGDTLSIRDGHPVLSGIENFDESYALPCGTGGACNLPNPITIPPGYYFMLGDNRGASDDSRFWGPVPAGWIIGRVE
jgi:signal peptidase I